jgi:hypothetical protein
MPPRARGGTFVSNKNEQLQNSLDHETRYTQCHSAEDEVVVAVALVAAVDLEAVVVVVALVEI